MACKNLLKHLRDIHEEMNEFFQCIANWESNEERQAEIQMIKQTLETKNRWINMILGDKNGNIGK